MKNDKKQIFTMLTLVFLMTMTACTQETKLPNEQMDTAIETAVSAPTTIVPTSTSEPIPETATAPATLAVPTTCKQMSRCSSSATTICGEPTWTEKTATLALHTPDDDAYFRLLLVKDQATDATLWQQEVPQVQTVYWSPDGQTLLLGNNHYNVADAAVWRVPADGSEPAQLLLPAALLLDIISQWHAE